VANLELAGGDDPDIWARAQATGAVLLTKDEDFVAIRQGAPGGPAVCWLRIGNATNPALLAWIGKVFPAVVAALDAGETMVEVR
jgi:predicted nuclease of predicted toxin-antitoxin system